MNVFLLSHEFLDAFSSFKPDLKFKVGGAAMPIAPFDFGGKMPSNPTYEIKFALWQN